jgi:hypothetical protein
MAAAEQNAMFDTCFDYDDHLRANGHWAGGAGSTFQHPTGGHVSGFFPRGVHDHATGARREPPLEITWRIQLRAHLFSNDRGHIGFRPQIRDRQSEPFPFPLNPSRKEVLKPMALHDAVSAHLSPDPIEPLIDMVPTENAIAVEQA